MPYHSFFGLQRAPFSSEIEPHQLFSFEAFLQCLARLEYGARERGMVAIIGEPGAGKTWNTKPREGRGHAVTFGSDA